MEQKFWIEKSKLNEIEWVKKYNLACDKWSKLTPNQIAIKYSYFSLNEHRKFINEICEKLNINLKGRGLEIGSGPRMIYILSILYVSKYAYTLSISYI
ncbi:MAG: hypothetical protein O3C31_05105 [Bacteroidetes bacterium]|nr:hypothetical protein [Bacteroidota bacterium]